MSCDGCTSNLSQSLQHFSNHKSAYAYFQAHQVFPRTVDCANCDKPMTLLLTQNKWRCQRTRNINGKKHRCTFTRALRTDTWLKGTHLSMDTLGKLIVYYMLLPPPHQDFIQNELQISVKTVVSWIEVLRQAELQWCLENTPQTIGGPNTVVEIDEAVFGHRKYHKGRALATQWVFGGVQRGTRDVFLELVPNRKQATLMEVIHRKIHPGTTIISDGWKAYNSISQEGV